MKRRIDEGSSAKLLAAVNADPEFQLAARFWNGSFRLAMGPEEAIIISEDRDRPIE
jgi:hypothetical protein